MAKILLVAGLLNSGDIPLIIKKNLQEMGHEAVFLPVDEALSPGEVYLHRAGRRFSLPNLYLFSRRLYARVRSLKPDILLVYGSNWAILPQTFRKIKRTFDCKLILWEGNLQFWRWFQGEALKYYDYVFVNDSYAVPLLKGPAMLKNVIHLPFNMYDPDIHKPVALAETEREHYTSDIAFIGMGYPERRDFFEKLTEFNLKLWGKKWDKSGKLDNFFVKQYVGMDEKIRIYQCAGINVNIPSRMCQIDGISAKIFEIAASGGFFLTEKKKDLSLFFKEEEEAISYSNIESLKDKIRYYLSHPGERGELAGKIRKKVTENWTYKNKLANLLTLIR